MAGPVHKMSVGRWRRLIGAAAVLVVFALLCEAKLWRPGEIFTIRENVQIAEAQSWWEGRLDLPERKWDSALFNGKVYSHFPPMFSFIAAAFTPWFGGVPHWAVVLIVVLPVPLLAYALFLRRTDSAAWAAVLAIGLMFGTSVYPVLDKAIRGAAPYNTNHTLAVVGLLILLNEFYGRRRAWLMGVGLIVAALSRQLTLAYAIPFVWAASQQDGERPSAGKLAAVVLSGAIAVGLPLALNTLKYGHPLDSGYMYIYNDRSEDGFSRDARTYGLFSAHYVPRNLYYANIGLPKLYRIEIEGAQRSFLRPNIWGTGVWWTTPLLLWVFLELRRLWREPADRVVLLGAALANAALLFYHSTGYQQRGFNRYSLDYVPALLALVAPMCCIGWRRWVSLAMVC
ncbi:MAG: hypothetical protein AAB385_04655, partial [Planctomycetota bacterium]